MTETFKVLLFLYLAGYIVAFITGVLTLLRGLFFFNSIQQKNLRLVLLKDTVFGETKEYEEPEAPSFKKSVKEFGWGIVIDLFISLLSWILLFRLAKSVISWLFTPPVIRLYCWKIKSIPFERAEDFLKLSQKEGFTTHSQYLKTKTLDKLSEKSEVLSRIFAYKVFGDRTAWANKYVNEARRLTKEEHDSVVIHPRFWAIPQDDVHARIAIRKYGRTNWSIDP